MTSANVVGYNTVTLKKGYNMLAVNFEACASDKEISIQDLIPGTTEGLTGDMDITKADQIQIYDPEKGGYTLYTLFYTSIPNPGLQAKNWKWCDAVTGNIATKTFKAGDSFWFNKQGAGSLNANFNGQVSNISEQEITIVGGWNMIGSAFPVNFNPNVLGTDFWSKSGAVGDMDITKADQIQVYDPEKEGYTLYTLFYTSIPNPGLQAKNWKWCDAVSGSAIADTIEVLKPGNGVWYKHQGSGFKFSITSPLVK